MPKVIVTGANGFVGKHLVNELRNNNYEVLAVGGRDSAGELTLDLRKADEAKKIDFTDVFGVFHLAGLAAVGPSFDNPEEYMQTNVGIQTNLFEAALAQGVKPRFLIISSGSLYDPKAELPLTESSAVLPSSPYAASKVAQEENALGYAKQGFESIIARPFNHVGPGQNPGFIVPDLAQQIIACEKSEAIEILVGNLDAQRDYTDVRDIARAYRLLLEKGVPGETYNICSGRALSGNDILSGLLKASEVNAPTKEDPAKIRPADNPVIYGSHDKLTKATGWQPEIPIENTFADVIADWRIR